MKKISRREKTLSNSVQSGWKWAFIGLLLVNISVIVIFGSFILSSDQSNIHQETVKESTQISAEDSFASIDLSLENQDAENLINKYLSEKFGENDLNLNVLLDDELVLTGQANWLFLEFPFSWHLDVYAMDSGDIQLRSKNSKIGRLNVPAMSIFNQLQDQLPFGDLVEFDEANDQIIIRVSDLTLTSGAKIKAKQIDLSANKWQFELVYPDSQNN